MKNHAFNDDGTLAIPTEAEITAQFEEGERIFDEMFPPRRPGDPEAVDIDPAPDVEPADLAPADLSDLDPDDLSPADFEDWLYS